MVARTNEYVKEKNTTFSAKFHVALLKYFRNYLLSNMLIYTKLYNSIPKVLLYSEVFFYKRIVLKVGFRCAFY